MQCLAGIVASIFCAVLGSTARSKHVEQSYAAVLRFGCNFCVCSELFGIKNSAIVKCGLSMVSCYGLWLDGRMQCVEFTSALGSLGLDTL